MSTPGNLSEQSLALPGGAGDVRSAGETFAADPQTGTGAYRIPVEVPPGHAGLTPTLALQYSTHGGNGVAGVGWSLGLAEVSRRTDKGLPFFDDAVDTFTAQGDELLDVGGERYRSRIEGRFARIRHVQATGRDFWSVEERDGTRVLYGLDASARLQAGPNRIARWYVSRKQDANGNEVVYTYDGDAAARARYLVEVAWAGCYRVVLAYEDRPDATWSHAHGFAVHEDKRLRQVAVQVRRSSDGQWQTFRRYELAYLQSALTGRSLLSEVRVIGIAADGSTRALPPVRLGYTGEQPAAGRWHDVVGHVGASLSDRNVTLARQSGSGLPDLLQATATGFWLHENLGDGVFGAARAVAAPAQTRLADRGVFISDMDGDGWGDLVVAGGDRVYAAQAGGGWSASVRSGRGPAVDLDDPGVRLADLTGNGLPDLLQQGAGAWWFHENMGDGSWASPVRVSATTVIKLSDPRVHLADLSGDGLDDLVYVGPDEIVVWQGRGRGRFADPVSVDHPFPRAARLDPRSFRFVDLTGSGQADLLYVQGGVAMLACNRGDLSFATPRAMAERHQTSEGHVEPVDLLGTGAMGLLFSDRSARPGGWRFFEVFPDGAPDLLSTIDNGIGATTTISYGSSGAHWARDRQRGRPWQSAMPMSQRVVDRVTTTDAVTGVVLGVEYRYHHGVYDGQEREFRGFAQVEQIDREAEAGDPQPLAQARVVRWYHTGVELDLRREYAPLPAGALSDDVVGQPDAWRALRGRLRREEVYALDGDPRPYVVTEHCYRVLPVDRRRAGRRRAWAPLQVQTRTTHTERTSDRRIVDTTTTYDIEQGRGYGLPIETRTQGYGRRGSFSTDHESQQTEDLERATRLTYIQRDEAPSDEVDDYAPAYLVDRVATVERYAVTTSGEELLSRERSYYDGTAYQGLGYPGSGTSVAVTRGRLSCRLELALTDALVSTTFPSGSGAASALSSSGGYLADGTDHYRHATRLQYDSKGMVTGSKDGLGNETTLSYDTTCELFPVGMVDPAGHPTTLERGELPHQVAAVEDSNGNRTEYAWDPTGLIASRAVMGKLVSGSWQGDPTTHPTEVYSYDFDASPVQVVIKTRQERLGATFDVTRYLDGFGRVVQERHTAEPDPDTSATRYRVTGWQVFNHKGLVVRAYQPVFASSTDYALGDTTTAHVQTTYDPIGRPVRVVHPDGTYETTTYHPWVSVSSDRNDNAGSITGSDPTYGDVVDNFADHLDTPTRRYVDALGREIAVSADNGSAQHVTRSVLDLADRVIEVWDPRGLSSATWTFVYDYAGQRLSAEHSTALGARYALPDASGNPIWARDARGIETTRTFDALNRPLTEHSDDGSGAVLRRAWRYVTYDEMDPEFSDWQSKNVFGRVEEVRDADGLRFFEYDWRGLVTSASHRFWAQKDGSGKDWNETGTTSWSDEDAWDPEVDSTDRGNITDWLDLPDLTDPTTIEVTTTYDAAGRPTEVGYPEGMAIRTSYDEAGHISGIEVDRDGTGYADVVADLRYNARGQLTRLTHGNGVVTAREHDSDLERLVRIYSSHDDGTLTEFQDLSYAYDQVGNPVAITDNLASSSYKANTIIPNTRAFAYDPRYRLIRATGKKHASVVPRADDIEVPSPDPNDYDAYDYTYSYDPVGNLTRNDEYASSLNYKSGRIDLFNGDSTEAGSFTDPATGNFRYDENGNTLKTPRLVALAYTHDDQSRWVKLNSGGDAVRYFRHADQRVLRFVSKGQVRVLSVYLGPFEYHHRAGGSVEYGKVVLHVHGHGRHAQVEQVLDGSDPDSLDIFYHHGDHLGSGHVLTKDDATLLSQEEYFPYGRSSDRRDARNRYRFIGVERDEDTGMCMTGPRQYDPVMGRFLEGDPAAPSNSGRSPFAYAACNPVRMLDPGGYQETPASGAAAAAPETVVQAGQSLQMNYTDPATGAQSTFNAPTYSETSPAATRFIEAVRGGGEVESIDLPPVLQQAVNDRAANSLETGRENGFVAWEKDGALGVTLAPAGSEGSMGSVLKDTPIPEGASRLGSMRTHPGRNPTHAGAMFSEGDIGSFLNSGDSFMLAVAMKGADSPGPDYMLATMMVRTGSTPTSKAAMLEDSAQVNAHDAYLRAIGTGAPLTDRSVLDSTRSMGNSLSVGIMSGRMDLPDRRTARRTPSVEPIPGWTMRRF